MTCVIDSPEQRIGADVEVREGATELHVLRYVLEACERGYMYERECVCVCVRASITWNNGIM